MEFPSRKCAQNDGRELTASVDLQISNEHASDVDKQVSAWHLLNNVKLELVTYMLMGISYSLQAPLFPVELKIKQIDSFYSGIVFGAYALAGIFSIPPVIYAVNRGYTYHLALFGPIIIGVSAVLFGLLDYVDSEGIFLTISIILRLAQGTNNTGVLIAYMSDLTTRYPQHLSFVMSILYSSFTLGELVGPFIGTLLFVSGGFITPFASTGFVLIIAGGVYAFTRKLKDVYTPPTSKLPFSVYYFCTRRSVMIVAIYLAFSTLNYGFNDASLTDRLLEFNVSTFNIGLVFVLFAFVNAVMGPIAGYLNDRFAIRGFLTIFGSILLIIGYLTIGPATFFPIQSSVSLIVISLVVISIGVSCCFTIFEQVSEELVELGLPDSPVIYHFTSVFFVLFTNTGFMLGPFASSLLIECFGYQDATSVIAGVWAISLILYIIERFTSRMRRRSHYKSID